MNINTENIENKHCNKCDIQKNITDFHKGSSTCKLCKKNYDIINKDRIKLNKEIWKNNNKDKILLQDKEYRNSHKEERNEYTRNWRKNNIEKVKESKKKYKSDNAEATRNYNSLYKKNRKKVDSLFKLQTTIRSAISTSIKKMGYTKNSKTSEILGCTFEYFKIYIESKFKDSMCWENYGTNGWHLDHITPLSYGKTEQEVYKLNHHTNFQPLWEFENLSKGNRWIG